MNRRVSHGFRAGGQGSAADTLQPLTGQIRSNAGLDAVQGYGGGGPGPGGVNVPQGPTTEVMTFGGYTFHDLLVSAAGNGITVASNLTVHAVDSPNAQAYPITYQSWVLVYAMQPNANDAAMLKAYIGYLIGAGQQLLENLGYAPLPSSLQQMAQAQLSQITS